MNFYILKFFLAKIPIFFYLNTFSGEDWKVCRCLTLVGCEAQDTRDEYGRERFLVFDTPHHIHGTYPKWYKNYDLNGSLKVRRLYGDTRNGI